MRMELLVLLKLINQEQNQLLNQLAQHWREQDQLVQPTPLGKLFYSEFPFRIVGHMMKIEMQNLQRRSQLTGIH